MSSGEHGPNDARVLKEDDAKKSVFERLRKKWAKEKALLMRYVRYGDDTRSALEMQSFITIWTALRDIGVAASPNWPNGITITVKEAAQTGLRGLEGLVAQQELPTTNRAPLRKSSPRVRTRRP